jgi:hypothetical protein
MVSKTGIFSIGRCHTSNSSTSKSIRQKEKKFHNSFLKKKGDNSSDNNWKMELTRNLKSKKTDDLTLFYCYNFGLPGSAANKRLSRFYPIANAFKRCQL